MPEEYKSSWADEVELDSGSLPPPTEIIDSTGQKILTEYKLKDDKKIKTVRTYKITKLYVSKSVARRKKLPKFGDSAKDSDGPNPHTTFVSEDINMQMITNKEEEKSNDAVLDPKSKFTVKSSMSSTNNRFSFKMRSQSAVSASLLISLRIVLSEALHRTLRRFSKRSRQRRLQQLKLRRRNLANTFHHSAEISRRTSGARTATTRPLFAFPISPNPPPTLIWKTSRISSARSPRCTWRRIRTPACAKASLTSISTTKTMLLRLLTPSTASATII